MMNVKLKFLQNVIFIIVLCNFVVNCTSENPVKKSVDDNRDDNGDTNDEKYESLDIPIDQDTPVPFYNVSCTRRQNSKMHEIKNAIHKQFPFMAAILSHQNEYLCSGTVVSNGLILTTAHCIDQSANYVLLNVTKAKRDNTAAVLRIMKSDKFPTYSGDISRDVGIIYTEKHNRSLASKLKLSNYTSTRQILDMEALGFGLNSDSGVTKDLQYIGLENRVKILRSKDMLRGYFDCIETKVVTCFKDTGGPAIYNDELVGIVVKGQNDCSKEVSTNFAVNKIYAEILPTFIFKAWLEERIKMNEKATPVALVSFPNTYIPSEPKRRHYHPRPAAPAPAPAQKYISSGSNEAIFNFSSALFYIFINLFT